MRTLATAAPRSTDFVAEPSLSGSLGKLGLKQIMVFYKATPIFANISCYLTAH